MSTTESLCFCANFRLVRFAGFCYNPSGIAGSQMAERMESYLYNMNQSAEATGGPMPPAHKPTEVATVSHDELRRGIAATRQFFFNHQHPDGYWVAELEGDALLQSETIMLLAFLGEENTELAKKCAVHLLDTQNEDGGWAMYTGGKSDVNNTVKAYFALKLTGHDPA